MNTQKKTFVAIAPDGSKHTRTSDHPYTHAVLVEHKDDDYWKRQGFDWGEIGFHSSLKLAQNNQRRWSGYGVYKSVIVVEVSEAQP